jgi:hypothetical protein
MKSRSKLSRQSIGLIEVRTRVGELVGQALGPDHSHVVFGNGFIADNGTHRRNLIEDFAV